MFIDISVYGTCKLFCGNVHMYLSLFVKQLCHNTIHPFNFLHGLLTASDASKSVQCFQQQKLCQIYWAKVYYDNKQQWIIPLMPLTIRISLRCPLCSTIKHFKVISCTLTHTLSRTYIYITTPYLLTNKHVPKTGKRTFPA